MRKKMSMSWRYAVLPAALAWAAAVIDCAATGERK
jgi:hypothetical protein